MTLVAINLGYVVAGAITVEVVFNWPGLGTLTVEALSGRDYPVLQGDLPAPERSVVAANLAADVDLRLPRSAGANVTGAAVPVRAPRPRSRGRRLARLPAPAACAARTASIGVIILVIFSVLALAPELLRRAARDGDHRDRAATGAAEPRLPARAPTSSGGACST